MPDKKLNEATAATASKSASPKATTPPMWNRSASGAFGGPLPDIQSSRILGVDDDSAAASGHLGQVLSAVDGFSVEVVITNGTYLELCSIVLPAGDWEITGFIRYDWSSAHVTQIQAGWTTVPEMNWDPTNGNAIIFARTSTTISISESWVLPTNRFQVAHGDTLSVKLAQVAFFTIGTASIAGRMTARRMR